jgi:hypothetical protein
MICAQVTPVTVTNLRTTEMADVLWQSYGTVGSKYLDLTGMVDGDGDVL